MFSLPWYHFAVLTGTYSVFLPTILCLAPGNDWEKVFMRLRDNPALMTTEGRLTGGLVALARARFDATEALMREIDANVKTRPRYVKALYVVLGTSKDPRSIPWLRAKIDASTPDREYIYSVWLGRWRSILLGMHDTEHYLTYKWLTEAERDRWRPFLIELYRKAPGETERVRCLWALTTCFHDETTIRYFKDLEPTLAGEQLLIVQAYLASHDQAINVSRLRKQIEALSASEQGRTIIRGYAPKLRHEAFVPPLLKMLEGKWARFAADYLRMVTLQSGLDTLEAWRQWWQAHRHESRAAWIEAAVKEAERQIDTNPSHVARLLSEGYYWGDYALIPHIERWLGHRELHRAIGGWVVMSYCEHHRGAYQRIAMTLFRESWESLGWYAREGLSELELVPGQVKNWDDWWKP